MASSINASTSGAGGVITTADNTGILQLQSASTTVATINAYGIGLGTGVPSSGIGITFPATQSASADANTLDDYEEGTWTPTFTTSTPGTFSATYSSQVGVYNKIGNLVIASFLLASSITKGTASGDLLIGGLPFNVVNTGNDQFTGCIGFMNPVLPSSPIGLLTSNNSTNIYIGIAAAGTLGISAVANGSYGVRGTIIYKATA